MDSLLARLHASRYILELDRPLAVLPELAAMRLERIDERTLSAEVPTEVGVHALFDALAAIGVRVMALRNAANRLEQLFFDLLDNARERPGDPV